MCAQPPSNRRRGIDLGSEALKEGGELCAFAAVEWCAELVFVGMGGVDDLLQRLIAFGCQAQSVGATVAGAGPAFDEIAVFEFVDEHDDAAARELEVVGEGLLGEPVGGADVPQRAGVMGLQAEGREALLIEPAAFGAELGQ